MVNTQILVVEDEIAIATLIEFNLQKSGFSVTLSHSVSEAQDIINNQLPDLLLIDWMLPDISGIQFIHYLRQDERTKDLPIIMLTARNEEIDKETGLNQGADDYITKPFSSRELIARINALLRRRAPQKTKQIVQIKHLILNPNNQQVTAHNKILNLSPSEFKLLHFFMTHPNRVLSRQQLLDLVWGDHIFIEERTVDVHIRRLRKALASCGADKWIETVHGSGYQFIKV